MLRSPLLGAAPRGPSLPSDPSRPCKSRRSMGLGSLGNERALSLSLFAEPELFPGFYELCGCQRTVVNINNLNLTLVRPPPPQSHPMLDFSSERGEGTAPFIIQNGMANRTLCRTAAAATVLKAAQIPPRLIQSLSAAVE